MVGAWVLQVSLKEFTARLLKIEKEHPDWLQQIRAVAKERATNEATHIQEAHEIATITEEARLIATMVTSGTLVYSGKLCKHGNGRKWECYNPAVAKKFGMCVKHTLISLAFDSSQSIQFISRFEKNNFVYTVFKLWKISWYMVFLIESFKCQLD